MIDAISLGHWFDVFSLISPSLLPQPLASAGGFENNEHLVIGTLLISAIAIFITSKIGEEVCVWMKLPPILGQLAGGIVVGISGLHILVFPETGESSTSHFLIDILQVFTGASFEAVTVAYTDQLKAVSEGVANLGIVALLFFIGLESDLKELVRVGSQAAIVAVFGVILPFTFGTLGLIALFGIPMIPAVFAGAALTSTSIGITAKVLQDLGHLKSKEGQIIIGAAVLDDILGIIILAVIISLIQIGTVKVTDIVSLILSASVFVGGAIAFSKYLGLAFVAVADKLKTDSGLLVTAIIVVLLFAGIANALGLEAILGAFAAGIILGETSKKEELLQQFQPIVNVISPVFFVAIGAKTDLSILNPFDSANWKGLAIAGFLIVVAILGKVATGYLLTGSTPLNRLVIGVGMIPRGEVGLVFAGLGAGLDAISDSLTAAVILMVVATTFLAPWLLQSVLQRMPEKYQKLV